MNLTATPPEPTPYPDVNDLLRLLHARLAAALDKRLVGVYLFGSLALGDFLNGKMLLPTLCGPR